MKTVEIRTGCHDPGKCGTGKVHVCGSLDACPVVRPDIGVVCTFGSLSRTELHEAAEIDAEYEETLAKYESVYGKATAETVSTLRQRSLEGKNVWTQDMEDETVRAVTKNVSDNRSTHDLNPAIFGHG